MNENKIKLILLIARNFSDEDCCRIFNKIGYDISFGLSNAAYDICALNGEWKESLHPRAQDGRFTKVGSGGGLKEMKRNFWKEIDKGTSEGYKKSRDYKDEWRRREEEIKSAPSRVEEIGRSNPVSKEIIAKKREIARLELSLDKHPLLGWEKDGEEYRQAQSDLYKAQRELCDMIRDAKSAKRKRVEDKNYKRVLKKKVKEFQDIEAEIDYIEERYARRDGSGEEGLNWKADRQGTRKKNRYEKLLARRKELDEEIDWDEVEDDE